MNPVYASVIQLCLASFRAFGWKVQVSGAEHLPASGAAVIATNHIGYLDFVFAGAGVRHQGKRRVRFVAKKEVFDHPVTGPLMRAMRHIAVDRGGDTDAAMTEAAQALRDGDLVGMFPEGTISRSFVPLEGRPGAARMAMDAAVPLVPCAVWGTQRLMTKGHSFSATRGAVISVDFGPAIAYQPGEDALAVHGRLMTALRAMVDDAQRRYPQQPSGPDDTWWLPAHLGGTAPTPQEAVDAAEAERAARRERRAAEGA